MKAPDITLSSHPIRILMLVVVTFVCYMPALECNFINLDDFTYIMAVQDLTPADVGSIFLHFYEGYHPLTLVSLAVNYHFGGLSPFGYHMVNVCLHVLNTIVVYVLVFQIFRRRNMAMFAALLFGIHPINVEAVAWVASRKDVQYSFFYLLGLLFYVRCLRRNTPGNWLATLACFLGAAFSKGMAASFVLSIAAIEYVMNRPVFDMRAILRKAPFLLLCLVFGVISIRAQQASGYAPETGAMGAITDRAIRACYCYSRYLSSIVLPINLSGFHPCPTDIGTARILVSAGVVVILGILVLTGIRRARETVFGILFFTANIVLVLQVVPVATFIVADRYAYLASIGILLIPALWFDKLVSKTRPSRIGAAAAMILLSLGMGVMTHNRCAAVWKNSLSFWNDVLARYPFSAFALSHRGDEFYNLGDYDNAVADFSAAIELQPDYSRLYLRRGAALFNAGNPGSALADFDRAIVMHPDHDAYNNRGLVKMSLGDTQGAVSDFSMAIELGEVTYRALVNRGMAYNAMKQWDLAIADSTAAIAQEPGYLPAYLSRAESFLNKGNLEAAASDAKHVLKTDPRNRRAMTILDAAANARHGFRLPGVESAL